MKDIIIKADNLYFSYDDEKSYSLNGLSLEIERGRKVAFMGANGAGKSTFFLTPLLGLWLHFCFLAIH